MELLWGILYLINWTGKETIIYMSMMMRLEKFLFILLFTLMTINL